MATEAKAASTQVDVGELVDRGAWGRYQQLAVGLTSLSVVIDGIDSQLLGIVIPAVMGDWGATRTAFAPILAAGFVGMMAGGAAAGVAGDRIGRRAALVASVLLFGSMTIGASMAPGLLALGVLRFFVGVGLQGATPNAAALVSEYVPERHRAFAVTATVVCVPLGAMLAGILAIPVLPRFGWRALFAIGGLIPIGVGLVLIRLLPESPRFLAARADRWPELARTLGRMGHRVPPTAIFVDRREAAARPASIAALFGRERVSDTLALWGAFFFCLLAVYSGFNWIPSMLTGAGLAAGVANTGITTYNLGGVVGAIGGALAIRRFGSRVAMPAMAAGAVAAAVILRSMRFGPGHETSITLMLGVIGALINAVQVTMYALGAHMYPTGVRATGVGTASSAGRIGAILSTYAGAWALERGGNRSFFLLVAASMLAVAVSLGLIRRHIPAVDLASSGRSSADGS